MVVAFHMGMTPVPIRTLVTLTGLLEVAIFLVVLGEVAVICLIFIAIPLMRIVVHAIFIVAPFLRLHYEWHERHRA